LFRVRVHRRAARALDDLPAAARRRVLDLLLVLEDDPAPVDRFDVKRIHGASGWFRVRVGGYRVIYWMDEVDRVVTMKVNEYLMDAKTRFRPIDADDVAFAVGNARKLEEYNDLLIMSSAKRLGTPLLTFDKGTAQRAGEFGVTQAT